MSNQPLVSIIMPAWNRADYLHYSIESVKKQTYRNWELIFCDDGSDDGTLDVANEFAKKDKRIFAFGTKRSYRPAIPRNKAISKAKGEWFAFLDADDAWKPKKLEIQIKNLIEKKSEFCCTNAEVVEKNKINRLYLDKKTGFINYKDLLAENLVITSSVVISRKLLEKCDSFPRRKWINEDYALWLKAAMLENVLFLQEPLVFYTNDSPNSARSWYEIRDQNKKKLVVLEDVYRWARGKGLREQNIVLRKIIKLRFWNIAVKSNIKRLIYLH